MKVTPNRAITVTVELDEEEATWLRDVLQNYPTVDKCPHPIQSALWQELAYALGQGYKGPVMYAAKTT
jgi:hypothetical protein